jgi:hypothetical protein
VETRTKEATDESINATTVDPLQTPKQATGVI